MLHAASQTPSRVRVSVNYERLMGRPSPVVVHQRKDTHDIRHHPVRLDPVRRGDGSETAAAMTNYYECTAQGHIEFTCLQAYYVGPKRYKKFDAWCDNCKKRYAHPEEGEK
jgi:hypothetical protein